MGTASGQAANQEDISQKMDCNLPLKRANARNPQDVPAWLALILTGRPWPVCEAR